MRKIIGILSVLASFNATADDLDKLLATGMLQASEKAYVETQAWDVCYKAKPFNKDAYVDSMMAHLALNHGDKLCQEYQKRNVGTCGDFYNDVFKAVEAKSEDFIEAWSKMYSLHEMYHLNPCTALESTAKERGVAL